MNEARPSFLSRLTSAYKTLFPRNSDAMTGNPRSNPVARAGRPGNWDAKTRDVYLGKEPFLSPGEPLVPREPEGSPPRQFQYPPGYNIQISPRSTESITFAQLRAMGEYTIIRVIIEHVKESLKSHEWDIVPDEDNESKDQYKDEIKTLREFFEMPDRLHAWDEWLGMMIEEVLVVDALSVYRRRTRGGDLYALEIIDGSTIKVLANAQGFEPEAPVPAYQQFLYGVPYAQFTRDEMFYLPRNRRPNKFYGFSPVEQMVLTVNQGLRRELYSLAQLTDGNIPAGIGELPKEWKLEQIREYEQWWNEILSGDPQNRARVRFVPEGFNYTRLQDGSESGGMGIFSPFDEWIARILCFGIGVSPMPFIKLTNRAVAQEMGDVESEGGVGSMKLFIERFCNRVIKYDFKIDHLVFNWVTDRSRMQQKRVDRNVKYVNSGIFQIDEVRAEEGKDPLNLPPGYPTATGYVTFEGAIQSEQAGLEAQDAATENLKNPPGDPQLKDKQDFQVDREEFRTKIEDRRRKEEAKIQAQAVSQSRGMKSKPTGPNKAQKAFDKCRAEELDKWERFALARSGSASKASSFDCEFIDDVEAHEIRYAILKASSVDSGLAKDAARKMFDDEVKHIFATRRMTQQPVRLPPAAARDAAHHVGDLNRVLSSVFQKEAQRIVSDRKIVTIQPLK